MRQANSRRDVPAAEYAPWLVSVFFTGDYFVDASIETLVELNTVGFDPHEMFDSATGTVIIVRDDYYIVQGNVGGELNSGIELAATVRLNGNEIGIRETKVASSTANQSVTANCAGVLRLVEGDVLSLYAYHNQVGGFTFPGQVSAVLVLQVQRAG